MQNLGKTPGEKTQINIDVYFFKRSRIWTCFLEMIEVALAAIREKIFQTKIKASKHSKLYFFLLSIYVPFLSPYAIRLFMYFLK
jgi:hypothetical protein